MRLRRQLTSGTRVGGREDDQLLQVAGAGALIGRAALGDHLVEPELDVALEAGKLAKRVRPGRDELRRRGVGRAAGRGLDAGAGGGEDGEDGAGRRGRRWPREPRASSVLSVRLRLLRLSPAPQQLPLLHQHLALLASRRRASRARARPRRPAPGRRTARCPASSPARPPAAARRSTSPPSRPHSRPTSIASPSGTKTRCRRGARRARRPARALSPSTSSESLARRRMVPRSRSSAADGPAPSWLTNARTVCPGWTPYSARMPRMAPTTCCTSPNSRQRGGIVRPARSGRGQGATEIEASAGRPGNRRQSASVTNGITGWSSRSATSNVCVATARATSPPGTSP